MVATALERLQVRLRTLSEADPSVRGVRALLDADAAVRLGRRADREMAEAGVGVVERAELLVATAELQMLAERASWAELRARSAAIAARLRPRPAPARRIARRVWSLLATVSAGPLPWPMPVTMPRARR